MRMADYKGAIIDYSKAIELDQSSGNSYFERGLIKYDLNDKIGACKDWSISGELGNMKAYDLMKQYCGN